MEMVSLSSIKVDNPYLRMNTDVQELEKSISTLGLMAPLIIDQKNRLLAGGRRFLALSRLGHTEAPCIRVDKDEYFQELISIDENLVRKDLNKMEVEGHLRRAKELYTFILQNDEVQHKKVEQELSLEEKILPEIENETSSPVEKVASQKFVRDISEKTGMSPRQIYQAIQRDEKASSKVKEARSAGELSISQTNEIIRLKADEQEKILPLIKDRTVSEIKKIIKKAKVEGIDQAIMQSQDLNSRSREIRTIIQSLKKIKKVCQALEFEDLQLSGKMKDSVLLEWQEVQGFMENLLPMDGPFPTDKNNTKNQSKSLQ